MKAQPENKTASGIAPKIRKLEREMIREVTSLLKSLKGDICDDYRASDDPDDNTPGMQVTVSTDDFSSWHYQTGDNSYSGGCYGDRHWSVIYLYRRSNCRNLATDTVNELADLIASNPIEDQPMNTNQNCADARNTTDKTPIGYNETRDDNQCRIFVGQARRDGKLPCTYVFPISDRKISKLLTPEKLKAERDNGFLILPSRR